MKSREEKRWELIQEVLGAEGRGDAPRVVSSQRTLFGIKSSVEEAIERIVAEDEAKRAAEVAGGGEGADEADSSAAGELS